MALGGDRAWGQGLARGLTAPGVPEDARDALVGALGALGCEAEFGLEMLRISAVAPQPTPAQGEQWLRQCFGLCHRLKRASNDLTLAAQAYLAALAQGAPLLAATTAATVPSRDDWAARFDATPDVWWPERGDVAVGGDSIEFWLCRAGFAYRHLVSVGFPGHLDALAESLALCLHALRTLPPAGVVGRASLYLGVQALEAEFAGDLISHHIDDLDARHVGILTGITTMLRLRAVEDDSITGDIAWARGELDRAREAAGIIPITNARATRPLSRPTGNLWARQIAAEWERTLAQLEAIRAAQAVAARGR